jgi:hypothetical protein
MERAHVDALRRLCVARGRALNMLLLLMLAARQGAWADAGEEPSYGGTARRNGAVSPWSCLVGKVLVVLTR